MTDLATTLDLTPSLEDYLETIYQLIRDHKVARVRDIARDRGVKAGSVTPALKRLRELGLIEYTRREFIDLTPEGARHARRVLARHRILSNFFTRVLKLPVREAEANACAMEHQLTDMAMDRLVRFVEFMGHCPDGLPTFIEQFQANLERKEPEDHHPCASCSSETACREKQDEEISLADLGPGEAARVAQVNTEGAVRQRLLDMGFLPDVTLEVERLAPGGDPLWVKLQGYQVSVRRREAASIRVVRGA